MSDFEAVCKDNGRTASLFCSLSKNAKDFFLQTTPSRSASNYEKEAIAEVAKFLNLSPGALNLVYRGFTFTISNSIKEARPMPNEITLEFLARKTNSVLEATIEVSSKSDLASFSFKGIRETHPTSLLSSKLLEKMRTYK